MESLHSYTHNYTLLPYLSISVDVLSGCSLYVPDVCQVSLRQPKQDQAVAERVSARDKGCGKKSENLKYCPLRVKSAREWENQTLKYCPLRETRQRMRSVKISREGE